uniref:Uncharacterized protein n=1 Tax=Avena sativa TaxID=4498 RepID=A0ACD5XTP2_AVESA
MTTSNLFMKLYLYCCVSSLHALTSPLKRLGSRRKVEMYSYYNSYNDMHLLMREVKRFADLGTDETIDLWVTAKEVGVRLEQYHEANSLTFTIQDGPQSGQTVPHVHIHVIPRKKGDFEKNDEIYDAIDVREKELKEKLDLDIERKDRTMEEMSHEASEYRALFS